MLGDSEWRDLLKIAIGIAVAGTLTVLSTMYIVNNYVIGERDDPLARAGGLSPAQRK